MGCAHMLPHRWAQPTLQSRMVVFGQSLSAAPQNKVTIIPGRHSRAGGNPEESLDARLRGHDGWKLDTDLCGAVLSWWD